MHVLRSRAVGTQPSAPRRPPCPEACSQQSAPCRPPPSSAQPRGRFPALRGRRESRLRRARPPASHGTPRLLRSPAIPSDTSPVLLGRNRPFPRAPPRPWPPPGGAAAAAAALPSGGAGRGSAELRARGEVRGDRRPRSTEEEHLPVAWEK